MPLNMINQLKLNIMKAIRLVIVSLIVLTTTEVYSQFYYTLDSLVTTDEYVASRINQCTTDVCPRANISIKATNSGMILTQYYRFNGKLKASLKMKYNKYNRVINGNLITTIYINKDDNQDIIYATFDLNNFSEKFEFKECNEEIYATYYFSFTEKEYLCLKSNYYETVKYTEK